MSKIVNLIMLLLLLGWVGGCVAGAFTGEDHLSDGGAMCWFLGLILGSTLKIE